MVTIERNLFIREKLLIKSRAAGHTTSKACICNAGTERERM